MYDVFYYILDFIFSLKLYNNIQRLFPSLRMGSHALGMLTIFTKLTIEMNSVCPAMASQKAMTLRCTENQHSYGARTRAANHLAIAAVRLESRKNVQSLIKSSNGMKIEGGCCLGKWRIVFAEEMRPTVMFIFGRVIRSSLRHNSENF